MGGCVCLKSSKFGACHDVIGEYRECYAFSIKLKKSIHFLKHRESYVVSDLHPATP